MAGAAARARSTYVMHLLHTFTGVRATNARNSSVPPEAQNPLYWRSCLRRRKRTAL